MGEGVLLCGSECFRVCVLAVAERGYSKTKRCFRVLRVLTQRKKSSLVFFLTFPRVTKNSSDLISLKDVVPALRFHGASNDVKNGAL